MTLTPLQQQRLNTLGPPWRDVGMSGIIAGLQDSSTADAALIAALSSASSPYNVVIYTGVPTTGDTLTIAVSGGNSDVFEFVTGGGTVADDANIGVVIGTADVSYTNLAAAINRTATANGILDSNGDQALYLGTVPCFAVVDTSANYLYVFEADVAGGTPVTGAGSNIAFTDALNNATLLRTNMNASTSAAAVSNRAALSCVVAAGDLSQTQPVQFAVPFLPTGAQIAVVDSGGRQKADVDVKWAAGTAVSGQNFLNVTLNGSSAGDPGVAREDVTIPVTASTTFGGYFSAPNRPVRVLQVEVTAATAPAGGTLVYNGIKTTASGTETTLASAVNIAGISAHDPTNITYDDAALPQALAATDKLQHQAVAGAGLSAPTAATFTTHYVVLVEAGDTLLVDVWG